MAVAALSTPPMGEITPKTMAVPAGERSPVKEINGFSLAQLARQLTALFNQYRADRRLAELRWLRNQRQYLGIYDPEVETELALNRSRAYPRYTRVKCISILSRIMELMFQGNEKNWSIKAGPWPTMTADEMSEALEQAAALDAQKDVQPAMDMDYIMAAIQAYADRRAEQMTQLVEEQLGELGGDQTDDYVALNRRTLKSGIIYGMGVMRGPFARKDKGVIWDFDNPEQPQPKEVTVYKPVFEWLPVWDYYPDMSAKKLKTGDGYFIRHVLSRAGLKDLGKRPDFMKEMIDQYLRTHQVGNYKADFYETELRAMGVRANVNEQKPESQKYEVIGFHGRVSAYHLLLAGVEVPEEKLAEDIDAEVWSIDGNIIKCVMNPYRALDVDMQLLHTFLFDEDDVSPIGTGLPSVMRDSQMGIAAATRMLVDNASVVCGPNLEVNTDLLRPDQDLRNISSYKVWYREGEGIDAQWPAVKNVQIDSHITDLIQVIELFKKFADDETFVGPATGGDMERAPSEPMRTAAGASMLRGDAALPFKDIIRSFDGFTQGIIQSIVTFNRQFNPDLAPEAKYSIQARGASSLMAKELRGMQADSLVSTLQPEEKAEIDMRKLILARLKARDMEDILVPIGESNRRAQASAQQQSQQTQQQQQMFEAQLRKILSDGYKNIASGQEHTAGADATTANTALDLLERGVTNGAISGGGGSTEQSDMGPNNDAQPGLSTGRPGGAGGGGPSPA